MPKIERTVVDRIQVSVAAWRQLAPDQAFAGMTLAEFEATVKPSLELRDEILSLTRLLEGKKAERSIADRKSSEAVSLVVNSIRGTQGYGPDCELYRAFGYVRTSERRSGLTRKRVNDAVTAVDDAA